MDRSCGGNRLDRHRHSAADAALRDLGLLLLVAAALIAGSRPAAADEFFLVRDENPLIRGFYLPLPSDGRLTDGADLSATLSISNTLNVENRPQESLLVDGESHTLRLSYGDALVWLQPRKQAVLSPE
jgi:hypothetical protein